MKNDLLNYFLVINFSWFWSLYWRRLSIHKLLRLFLNNLLLALLLRLNWFLIRSFSFFLFLIRIIVAAFHRWRRTGNWIFNLLESIFEKCTHFAHGLFSLVWQALLLLSFLRLIIRFLLLLYKRVLIFCRLLFILLWFVLLAWPLLVLHFSVILDVRLNGPILSDDHLSLP